MFFHKKPKIRTRFAPSPTGYVHMGSLRTALYDYLLAKQVGGDFVLRVEDTDKNREVSGAVENLLKSLKWAGIEPDEGVLLDKEGKPTEKGHFGPYTQSKRLDIYHKYAQQLVKEGYAYYCFCSSERLETLRQEQQANKQPTKYDGRCLGLTVDEIEEKLSKKEPYVIRMKVPANQEIEFNDLIRGNVKFSTNEVDDQVLMKSDGFPTYHLASIVDDHLMEISHVIRGEEWLSSTPKHILLYQFFGWKIPQFAHLPLLLNPDKSKLSKRQGDVAVEDYRAQGYLPNAIVNFVALLGWNPGGEQEIFSLDELVRIFDLGKVHKAGAVFNREKLDWMNAEYIKKLTEEEFTALALPYFQQNIATSLDGIDIAKIMKMEQQRVKRLDEVGKELSFIFTDNLQYDSALLVWKKSDKETAVKNLGILSEELKKYEPSEWSAEKLQDNIIRFIKDSNLTNGEVLWPMRVALTGLEKSPTPFEVAAILGKEKSLDRIEKAIASLK